MKIYSGSIITCDDKNTVARYLVEDGGTIRFVGDELPGQYRGAPVVELGERALLPAFAGTADIPLPALETENLPAHVPAAPRDAVRAPMQAVRLLNFEALLNQCF